MPKLLVSVVNYCDPEFEFTVKSLWDNAANKQDLIFSLVSEDSQEYDFSFIPEAQLFYQHFDLSEYRGGVCWARDEAVKVADFDYLIQFDSHTFASAGWDQLALDFYATLAEPKTLVCYSPAVYEINQDETINTNVYPEMSQVATYFNALIPGFSFPGYDKLKLDEVVQGYWVTCCYLFAPKAWVDEVGFDPDSSFNTEEFNLSLRTYAAGWNVYAKGCRDVFHHASHKQKDGTVTREVLRPWADGRKEAYWKHVKAATNFASRLMSGNADVDLATVERFFARIGLPESYTTLNEDYYSYIEIPNRGHGMPPARS
jgi:hypothetical protein